MDNTQTILINISNWVENIDTATRLAADLLGLQESSNETWNGHHEDTNLTAYIRYEDGPINATPIGVTDV